MNNFKYVKTTFLTRSIYEIDSKITVFLCHLFAIAKKNGFYCKILRLLNREWL
ncbi:hypothetical protein SAMN05661044_04235 [Olivibacter domesticus]|uniref:Uncharacterized protein n=1 Tax=Olivibacter domesticus TaxID=407022 RepID=A0A1H7VKQ0_OLID1|nr:hypothetical protein SAMN05661044_04235 [Olivibacter domesticus]